MVYLFQRFDEKEKEPFGPGCRDYFWLVCRLVDSINKEDAKQSWELVRQQPFPYTPSHALSTSHTSLINFFWKI